MVLVTIAVQHARDVIDGADRWLGPAGMTETAQGGGVSVDPTDQGDSSRNVSVLRLAAEGSSDSHDGRAGAAVATERRTGTD